MAALRSTSLLLLALMALATLSATAEAGYPSTRGPPPCNRYDCAIKPAVLIDFQLSVDVTACPGLVIDVAVLAAVAASEQARRVCPGGRRTSLSQVQVAASVEAKVEVQVLVLNRRGRVLAFLSFYLDVKEFAVVKGSVAAVVITVKIDVQAKVLQFWCGNQKVYEIAATADILAGVAVVP